MGKIKKEDRYQNAFEMRADLEKLQLGKNIKAANSLKIEQIRNEIIVLKQDIFELKNMETEKTNIKTEKMRKELSLAQSKQKKLETENEKLCIRLGNLKSNKEELEQQNSKLNRKNIELQKENNELLNSKSVFNCNVVGNTISFGRYPQDEGGRVKPIEWTVMKTEKNKMLLLSKYVLDAQPYNKEKKVVTWQTSDIRRWLNSDFYTTAFNNIEQKKIADTLVKTENNSEYGTDGGNDTKDKVFLLSIEEAESFFINDGERKAKTTKYAEKAGVFMGNEGYPWWWLRSPGKYGRNAAGVYYSGSVDRYGRIVDYATDGVRPALWLNL